MSATSSTNQQTTPNYKPHRLPPRIAATDWIADLDLSTARHLSDTASPPLRFLVLYGSLRQRSYSKLLAFEVARLLDKLGCDVRVFNPTGLPVKDGESEGHPKVQELRGLSEWSDGHFWVSPEQHGNLTAVFKNQIDWIPLSAGSVRPTQNRTLGLAMVSGGSQSFNTVNSLRILGRWMRMWTICNQSSVPRAYEQFSPAAPTPDGTADADGEEVGDGGSRMLPSGNRDRLVDCVEELVKFTVLMRPHKGLFDDRFSEREEGRRKKAKAEQEELEPPPKSDVEKAQGGSESSTGGRVGGKVDGTAGVKLDRI